MKVTEHPESHKPVEESSTRGGRFLGAMSTVVEPVEAMPALSMTSRVTV
jgi:hypothetical protein